MRALAPARLSCIFVLASLVGLAGCPSARQSCEHYRNKSFNPMPDSAIEACTKVCEQGDEEACEALEHWAREAGHERVADAVRDQVSGVSCTEAACAQACREREDPLACLELGLRYHYGAPGITVDLDAAAEYYALGCATYDETKGCDFYFQLHGDEMQRYEAERQFHDGHCPGDAPTGGSGLVAFAEQCVAPCLGRQACDHWLQLRCETALEVCERACEEGDAAHCRQLFLMLREGRGVAQNRARSEEWRARACELEDPFSCHAGEGALWLGARKLKPQSM